VIQRTKFIFAKHGILQEVVSDNGPQYSSLEFRQFQLVIQNSPKSNGEAERAVQTVKRLLKKADDPYIALLTYLC